MEDCAAGSDKTQINIQRCVKWAASKCKDAVGAGNIFPPPPSVLCFEFNRNFFIFFSKKVLTIPSDSCNIIQVADRHGNETAQQALIGRPLMSSKSFEKLQKSS